MDNARARWGLWTKVVGEGLEESVRGVEVQGAHEGEVGGRGGVGEEEGGGVDDGGGGGVGGRGGEERFGGAGAGEVGGEEGEEGRGEFVLEGFGNVGVGVVVEQEAGPGGG